MTEPDPTVYLRPAYRREVLKELRTIAYRLHMKIGSWNHGASELDGVRRHSTAPGDVCEDWDECQKNGGRRHVWRRARLPHEFNENNPIEWRALAQFAGKMAERFIDLERMARRAAQEVEDGKQRRALRGD